MSVPSIPATVGILGTCISRDLFNSDFVPEYKNHFTVVAEGLQTCVIALMTPPVELDWSPTGDTLTGPARASLEGDLARSLLDQLRETTPDYLMVDLRTEAYAAVLLLPDGRAVTDNRFATDHTNVPELILAVPGARRLDPLDREDTDEYLALFEAAWARFVEFMREHSPNTRIVLHKARNARRLRIPHMLPLQSLAGVQKRTPLDVDYADEVWTRAEDIALRHAPDADVIDMVPFSYPSSGTHRWGGWYVHYSSDYHRHAMVELTKLELQRRFGPYAAQLGAFIEANDQGRWEVPLEAHRAAVVRFRKRIHELETAASAPEEPAGAEVSSS